MKQIIVDGIAHKRVDVTVEQLQHIRNIYEAYKGTRKYGKMQMYHEAKNTNGRWFDIGWGVPRVEEGSYLKVVGDYLYLMQKQGYVDVSSRYCVTAEVMELFGWEVK